MNRFRIYLCLTAAAAALTGCAHPPMIWDPASPAKNMADFPVDDARCKITAQQITPSYTAMGAPMFVAIAAAAHNDQIRDNYRNCMVITGWRQEATR